MFLTGVWGRDGGRVSRDGRKQWASDRRLAEAGVSDKANRKRKLLSLFSP